jgi:hypothetical protein
MKKKRDKIGGGREGRGPLPSLPLFIFDED